MVFHDKHYSPKIGLHTTTETDSAAKYMYMYIIDKMYIDKFFPPVTVFLRTWAEISLSTSSLRYVVVAVVLCKDHRRI